jgi:hypothetical protein
MNKPKVNDKIKTWFSDKPDGLSTIMEVRKYDGRYTEYFTYILKVTAPRTYRGWMEICI